MKRLIIALALLISPTVLQAEESAQSDDRCKMMGDLAHSIMKIRQNGVALSTQLGLVKEKMPSVFPAFKPIIIMAYEETQWNSKKLRADAANEFRDKIELACYTRE